MAKQKVLLMLIRRDIHRLEYDPATQYRFHFTATWFWFMSMIALPFLPVLWGRSVPALVVQEISLWANLATHFGSMSSALAAKQTVRNILRHEQPNSSEIQHEQNNGSGQNDRENSREIAQAGEFDA